MKQKLLFFLTAVLLAMLPVSMAHADVTKNGIRYSAEIDGKELPYYSVVRQADGKANYINLSGEVTFQYALYDKYVTTIREYAFSEMQAKASFTVGGKMTTVSRYSFYKAVGLQSITLTSSVTTVGEHAFDGCTQLTSVSMSSNIKVLQPYTFAKCTKLPSINIASVTQIGEAAFKGSSALVSVGASTPRRRLIATSIGDEAFANCQSLQNIYFAPDKLTYIGASAFSNCKKLKTLTLPATVVTIKDYAFAGSGLKVLTNNSTTPQNINANVFSGIDLSKCILYVPQGTKAAYKAANVWKKFGNILEPGEQPVGLNIEDDPEEDVTAIYSGMAKIGNLYYTLSKDLTAEVVQDASYKNNLIGKLVIPQNVEYKGYTYTVTSIAAYAFTDCKITAVELPNTITTLAHYAFYNCKQLESINFPSSLSTIGESCFEHCSSIHSVDLSKTSVEVIPSSCFSQTFMETIVLPKQLKRIEYRAFAWCRQKVFEFPESVEYVGNCAFLNNSVKGFQVIVNVENPALAEDSAFYNAGFKGGLTVLEYQISLTVPNGCIEKYRKAKGWERFYLIYDKGLTEKIKYGQLYYQLQEDKTAYVTYEKNEAGNYSDIKGEVTVEKELNYQGVNYIVTDIGAEAFRYATGITKVNLPNNLEEIGAKAFSGCTNLAEINIPATLTALANDAFVGTKLYSNNTDANGAVYYYGCLLALTKQLPSEYIVKDGTRLIATNVFNNQKSLTSLTLPEGLTTICNGAIAEMSNLKTISLPSTLSNIGNSFLSSCSALTSIYNYATKPFDLSEITSFVNLQKTGCSLYVPKGSKSAYTGSNSWKEFPILEMAPKTYTVTFVDHEGKELDTQIIEVGNAATAPWEPEREGYTFIGWDKDFSNIQANLTVTAQYEKNKYFVTFLDYDGTSLGSQEVEHGQSAVAPAEPVRTGYTFTGWDKEFDIVTQNMDVTAQYALKVWTVTYLNYDNSLIGTEQVVNGEDAKGMVATRKGWIFGQWYNTKNFEYVDLKNITSDMTVKAEFSGEILFDVIYRVEGVTTFQIQAVYGLNASQIYYKPTNYPLIPQKESDDVYDYTFVGWTPEVSYITENIVQDAVFEASLRKFTVKFVDWNDITLSEQIVEYGSEAEAPTPERTGYTFTGWDKDLSFVTSDLTVKAQYTINTYSVTFVDYDDAVLRAAQVVEYGGDAVPPADPVRKGYTFTGWAPDYKNVTGDMTVKAQYTINQYTVTFVDHEGKELSSATLDYGTMPTPPQNPVRESTEQYDYTFKGWSPEVVAVSGDATYTATYTQTLRQYNVTFVDHEGKELSSATLDYGTMPTPPQAPVRESSEQYDYTFKGWSPEVVAVSGDATYTATYTQTLRQYTIRFLNYDGSVLQSSEWEYGTTPVYSGSTPLRAEDETYTYEFKGWDKEIVAVSEATDYTAQFNAVAKTTYYTVTFLDWDGTELFVETVEEGKDAHGPAETPTRNGYTFIGWSKPLTNITSDLTVVAQYEIEKVYHTVTFLDWDGTELLKETVEDGQDAQGPAEEPTRNGYTFIGWSKPITNITEDLTVVALYEEATGVEDINKAPSVNVRKELRNGHVVIIMPDGKEYNTTGAQIK